MMFGLEQEVKFGFWVNVTNPSLNALVSWVMKVILWSAAFIIQTGQNVLWIISLCSCFSAFSPHYHHLKPKSLRAPPPAHLLSAVRHCAGSGFRLSPILLVPAAKSGSS